MKKFQQSDSVERRAKACASRRDVVTRRDALKIGATLTAAEGMAWFEPPNLFTSSAAEPNANRNTGRGGDRVGVGFSRADLAQCMRTEQPARRPLEAVCAVFVHGETTVALVALDLCEFSPADCRKLQDEIHAVSGIPVPQILLHTTHTHSSPMPAGSDRQPGLAWSRGLGEVLGKCVQQALGSAKPARARWGATDVGKRLSVNRCSDAGADLGAQTFWFGYVYHDGDDRPDASALVNEMRTRWLRQPPRYQPGPEPIWFDGPVDPWVLSVAFEDDDGRPLGSIIRFCAHPHLACLCRDGQLDSDFPYVARDYVARKLGGTCLYLSGPCGDLVPKDKVKYVLDPRRTPEPSYLGPTSRIVPERNEDLLTELERIGTEIGEAVLRGFDRQPAEPLTDLRFRYQPHRVPLDPALPRNSEEAERMRAGYIAEYEGFLNQGGPLRELRRTANRLNWSSWFPSFAYKLLTPAEMKAGNKEMPLSALWLGEHCLLFMHSEICVETTRRLQQLHPNLFTVSLTGGSIGYFPTAAMIDDGGYEGRQTLIRRDAEELLRELISGMLLGATKT